ncbi:MAG: hypothetical protein RLZZ157_1707, partial [Pseudomonadota bacterium]
MQKSLTTTRALVDARLIAPEAHDAIEAVAAQYAIAITPQMQALIDP